MKTWIVLLSLLLPGAALAEDPDFPIPPIPPDTPPPMSAPVPDRDIQPPTSDNQSRARMTLDLDINRRDEFDPSRGFVPGSHWDPDQEHRQQALPKGLPGLLFHIPFP